MSFFDAAGAHQTPNLPTLCAVLDASLRSFLPQREQLSLRWHASLAEPDLTFL
jgi:hypothetical protein